MIAILQVESPAAQNVLHYVALHCSSSFYASSVADSQRCKGAGCFQVLHFVNVYQQHTSDSDETRSSKQCPTLRSNVSGSTEIR